MNNIRNERTLPIIFRRNDSSMTLRSSRDSGEKWAYFKDMRLYNLLDLSIIFHVIYSSIDLKYIILYNTRKENSAS